MARNETVGGAVLELKAELAQFSSEIRRGDQQLRTTAKDMQRSLQSIAKETERTHNSVVGHFNKMERAAKVLGGSLAGLFAGVTATRAIGEASKLSDAFSGIDAKIKVATNSQAEFNRVFNGLYEISQKNKASFEDSVTAFQNLTAVGKDLGATTNDLLKMTDIVQKLGKISGAGPMDMANGLRGLTQALASGNVQADEFRQISDNLPGLANQIAAAAGISLGQLRKLVKDGKVASKDLYDLLMKSADDVNKKYQAVGSTMSGAFQQITNALTVTVGKIDKSIGLTNKLAHEFENLAKSITRAGEEFVKWNNTATGQKRSDGSPLTATGKFFADAARFNDDLRAGWHKADRIFDPGNLVETRDKYGTVHYKDSGKNERLYQQELRKNQAAHMKRLGWDPDYLPSAADMASQGFPKRVDPFNFTGKDDKKEKKSQAQKDYESDLKHVELLVAKRKEEALELRQVTQGMDELARQYDREKRDIEDTTLSAKQKKAALKDLATAYEEIRKQQGFEKARKEQKEANQHIDDFIKKTKDQLALVDEEVKGRANLNQALKLEHELKQLIAKGNKGSTEVAGKHEQALDLVEQAKRNAIAKDAADIYKDLTDKTASYKQTVEDTVGGLAQHREELQRQLKGEQELAPFLDARKRIETETTEQLEKQREALDSVNQLLERDAANAGALEKKRQIEADINTTIEKRVALLRQVDEEQQKTKDVKQALSDQKDLIDEITGSTHKYKEKVQELSDAFADGKITAEQYDDALRKIRTSSKDGSASARSFASSVTGTFSNMFRGSQTLGQSFRQLGIDLGNLAAKRFVLAPLEKMIARLFDNIAGGIFGGGSGSTVAGAAGGLLGGALSGISKGLATGSGAASAAAAGAPNLATGAPSGVSLPVASLPMLLADPANVKQVTLNRPEIDKADFTLPMFRGARLPIATFYESLLPSAYFENSRHKKDDFFDSLFFDAEFRSIVGNRGFFKTSWFDTSSFKKPILDGATFKNATVQAAGGQAAGGSSGVSIGGFGSYIMGRASGVANGMLDGILMRGLAGILGFAQGGSYNTGMGPRKVGERGTELFFPGVDGYIMNSQISQMYMLLQSLLGGGFGGGMGGGLGMPPAMMTGASGPSQIPWTQRDVYSGGRGGYSGGGMISQLDNSQMLTGLYRDKYDSGVRAFQNGDPNAPSWYTLRELEYHANRHRDIVANNGFTGQLFSRQQFESSSAWAEANEASYMWGGQRNDPRRYLNSALWGEYDPSQRMSAQSFGLVSSGMGGGDLILGAGTYDRNVSNTAPLDANRASAFSNPFNGGDLRSASQLGSYLLPLLRGGMGDHSAVARISGGSIPLGTPSAFSGDQSRNWQDISRLPSGSVVRSDGSIFNPANDWASKYDPAFPGYKFGGATQQAAFPLFGDLADITLPPQVEQILRNAYDGYKIVNAGNPSNFTPSGVLQAQGMNILGDVLASRPMWKGDGNMIGAMQSIMSQPWANKSMSMMQMPAAMRLFGYKSGGRFKGDRPMKVGERGEEWILPDGPGSVVPNRQVKEALATQVKINVINNTGVKATATQTTMPDGSIALMLNAIPNMMRDPSHPIGRTVREVARGH